MNGWLWCAVVVTSCEVWTWAIELVRGEGSIERMYTTSLTSRQGDEGGGYLDL